MKKLTKNCIYLLFFPIFLFYSCSTVNLTTRKDKDIWLNSKDYLKLKGIYSNQAKDSSNFRRSLFESFTLDTLGKRQNGFYIDIVPIDENTLTVNLYQHNETYMQDDILRSITVKGKFKNGYFKVKRQYLTKFVAGPLLWVLGERQIYIGLTKENNLVVLDSGGKGVLFFVIVPFFIAGGDKYNYEYTKIK